MEEGMFCFFIVCVRARVLVLWLKDATQVEIE